MTPHTDTLITLAGTEGAAFTGSEFALNAPPEVSQVVVVFSVTSGTGTMILEGRNGTSEDWVQLTSANADQSAVVTATKRLRVRTTGATALVARVTINRPVKDVTGF